MNDHLHFVAKGIVIMTTAVTTRYSDLFETNRPLSLQDVFTIGKKTLVRVRNYWATKSDQLAKEISNIELISSKLRRQDVEFWASVLQTVSTQVRFKGAKDDDSWKSLDSLDDLASLLYERKRERVALWKEAMENMNLAVGLLADPRLDQHSPLLPAWRNISDIQVGSSIIILGVPRAKPTLVETQTAIRSVSLEGSVVTLGHRPRALDRVVWDYRSPHIASQEEVTFIRASCWNARLWWLDRKDVPRETDISIDEIMEAVVPNLEAVYEELQVLFDDLGPLTLEQFERGPIIREGRWVSIEVRLHKEDRQISLVVSSGKTIDPRLIKSIRHNEELRNPHATGMNKGYCTCYFAARVGEYKFVVVPV